jgi:hypothetical protein
MSPNLQGAPLRQSSTAAGKANHSSRKDHGNSEMSSRGLQALGVVFDPPNVRDSDGRLVAPMVDYFKLTYPVGFAIKQEVDNYLMRGNNQILNIPQIVVIDKAGNIRARSDVAGRDSTLEDKSSLRALVHNLLDEGTASKSARK